MDAADPCAPCLLLLLLSFFVCLFLLALMVPTVFLVVGVLSNEACDDQPLAMWCKIMLGCNLAVAFVHPVRMNRSPMRGDEEVNRSNCDHFFICLASFAWILGAYCFVQGALWFHQAGGFGDPRGNCHQVAPVLFRMVWWYYLIYGAFFAITLLLLCTLCCIHSRLRALEPNAEMRVFVRTYFNEPPMDFVKHKMAANAGATPGEQTPGN